MFMTTVIRCHSLSNVIFNAKMTLFEMFLLWARVRGKGRGSVRSNNVIFNVIYFFYDTFGRFSFFPLTHKREFE